MASDNRMPHERPLPMVERDIPQLVPSPVCLSCEVCCRFPEQNSFLRPYFTREEIGQAVRQGIEASHFPDHKGCQVQAVPHPHGEGYLCPAFDPETSFCRIYKVRPLDCQIYPFTLMWDADHKTVLLGWDKKCPYMTTEALADPKRNTLTHQAESYASRVHERLDKDEQVIDLVINNPQLVTPYQDEVVVIGPLAKITEGFVS